ncbi:MAG: hypothetical protein ABSB53_05285 [Nitrososphaerales archaeon]
MIRTKKGIASNRIGASPSGNCSTEEMEVGFVVVVIVVELVIVVSDVVVSVGRVLEVDV